MHFRFRRRTMLLDIVYLLLIASVYGVSAFDSKITQSVCRNGAKLQQQLLANGSTLLTESEECCVGYLRDAQRKFCSPCPNGWTGRLCQTPCPEGRFGPACAMKCSECSDCDRYSGHCPEIDWSKAWADGRLLYSILTILLVCLAVAVLSMAVAYTMFYRRRRSQGSREERCRITSDVDAPAESHIDSAQAPV